jgi:hypothetical protein
MKPSPCLIGALLIAAPLFSQKPLFDPVAKNGRVSWFLLGETRDEVARIMGPPAVVAGFGDDFISWQYRLESREDEEPSHYLIFRKSDGKLLSATRNFSAERDVSALFPETFTTIHEFRDGTASYPVAVRKLDTNRLLLAMGASRPGDPVRQVVLIRASELQYFHPWLKTELERIP